jgi:hypothetical protein
LLDEDIESVPEKQDDSEILNLSEALDRSCVFADNTSKPDSGNIEKENVVNDDNLENKTADKIYSDKPQQPVIDFPRHKKTHSRKRVRDNENNLSFDQTKESYDKIIDVYISELKTRFPKDELKSVIVLYNLLMLNDEKENSDSNYTDLLIY